jgi:hypothetical protein
MLDELEPRVQELERNQGTLDSFLATLDTAKWNQTFGSEGYNVRQTLAHLSGANKSMVRMGQNWIAGRDNRLRSDFDLNFFNARQQAKRAELPDAELVAEWRGTHQDFIDFMKTVRAEDLEKRGDHPLASDTTLRNLFLIITTHEANHIRELMDAFSK